MIILGIETSCDDTSVALVEKNAKGFKILSNIVSSQIKIHADYGGVVPNLAAREHLKNIEPCLNKTLRSLASKLNLEAKLLSKIDLIAVTIGPGLIPSLLVGVNFAKALSYNWQKPIIGINHIEGHIYANWINPIGTNSKSQNPNSKQIQKISFPALCLVVSGGHTQLILMKAHGKYNLLGETRDDAAGEAFDKVAKLLGLGYPGGPIISQRAEKGNAQKFNLPRPMINRQNFDFSFSGLKTAVLYEVKREFIRTRPRLSSTPFRTPNVKGVAFDARPCSDEYINDMAASFQQAVIDVLIHKTIKAAQKYNVKSVLLSGGVAANKELRRQMEQAVKNGLNNVNFQMPDIKLCTDNAAMICVAAFYKKKPTSKQSWLKINANSNLKLFA